MEKRYRMLPLLLKGGKSTAELAEVLGLTPVTIAADFRLLASEKLVYREKDKNFIDLAIQETMEA